MRQGLTQASRSSSFKWLYVRFGNALRSNRRPAHSDAHTRDTPHRDLQYSRLIDPSSLKNTLKAVREANRSSLIRKIDQTGRSFPLTLEPEQTNTQAQPPSSRPFPDSPRKKRVGSPRKGDKVPTKSVSIRGLSKRDERLEISGRAFPLLIKWLPAKGLSKRWRLPWISRITPTSSDHATAHQRLAAEIIAFRDYFTPTTSESLAAAEAFKDIERLFKSIKPSCTLELIGSRASGLASSLSDLDINIKPLSGQNLDDCDDRDQASSDLHQLAMGVRRLAQSPLSTETNPRPRILRILEMLRRSRVPLIRGIHSRTGLEVQIQQTVTVYNSTEYAKAFLKEYPTLRAVFLVLKQMLAMRGLSEGSHGGLTSYPLLNMIVACLKLHPHKGGEDDVATHLLSFLQMYSEIDFDLVGLSVSPPAYISPSNSGSVSPATRGHIPGTSTGGEDYPTGTSSQTSPVRTHWSLYTLPSFKTLAGTYHMRLIDAADPSNDLGRNSYLIKHVQMTLKMMRRQLQQAMESWDENMVKGQPSQTVSLLACMLEGNYQAFELDRATLQMDGNQPRQAE